MCHFKKLFNKIRYSNFYRIKNLEKNWTLFMNLFDITEQPKVYVPYRFFQL